MHFPQIKHKDWLKDSTVEKTHRHYREGLFPPSIAGFMLVTAHKHDLRAIYGSDLRAGLALTWFAIMDYLALRCYRMRYKIGLLTKTERQVAEDCERWDKEEAAGHPPDFSTKIHRNHS